MLKWFLNILVIGYLVAFCIFSYERNQIEPEVSEQLMGFVEEWKRDVSKVGIDGDDLIKRVDKIIIVDRIPVGLLNSRSTTDVIGRFDYSTRSIYILSRKYEEHQLKALVYHELGHYLFHLNHTGGIMDTHVSEESGYYKDNWSVLLPTYLEKCKRSK